MKALYDFYVSKRCKCNKSAKLTQNTHIVFVVNLMVMGIF